MKRILLILPVVAFTIGLFAQPNPTQATIKKTGPWTVTIYAKPTTTTTTNDINCSFAVSVLHTSGPGPCTNCAQSLIGGTINTFTPEVKNGRRVYPFQLIVQSAVTLIGGQDNAIATVTFDPLPLGEKKIQMNDYTGTGSDWAYWYISHSGNDNTNYAAMYYGTGASNNWNGGTGDSKVDINSPLPINLLSFNAKKSSDNKSAELVWSTASEANSSYFGIERSTDKINWKTIGNVNAAGNSQIVLNYQYLDKNVNLGSQANAIIYYRLKMVDLDGTFEYSPIESVNFENGRDVVAEDNTFLVYPNPATEGIHVEWSSSLVDQPTQLEFYDISGKLVHVEKVGDQTNEQYVDFTKANIQSGLCLMRVMSGDKPIQYKQIVVGQDH